MMNYKGYAAEVTYDDEAKLLHGDVVNMRDVVTFQADNVEGLQKALEESVDDYLEFCTEDGVDPQKPYSGKFQVRISPELHHDVTILAVSNKKSLNGYIEMLIKEKIDECSFKT